MDGGLIEFQKNSDGKVKGPEDNVAAVLLLGLAGGSSPQVPGDAQAAASAPGNEELPGGKGESRYRFALFSMSQRYDDRSHGFFLFFFPPFVRGIRRSICWSSSSCRVREG